LRELLRILSTNPMSLTRQDVEKIAHLARLSITAQEMPVYVSSTNACEPMWCRRAITTRNTNSMPRP
jgi:hypothetical protein